MENTGEISFNISERILLSFYRKGSKRYTRAKNHYELRLSLAERIKEEKRNGRNFLFLAISGLILSIWRLI